MDKIYEIVLAFVLIYGFVELKKNKYMTRHYEIHK